MDAGARTPSPDLDLAPGCRARFHAATQALDGRRRALLLWLPGGGFTGDMPAEDRVPWLTQAGADVLALELPRPPEHPFPAGVEAAFHALRAVARRPAPPRAGGPARLFVGGEDAGANIAAALTLLARDQEGPALAGQVLLSPMLDPRLGSASMRQGACGGVGCPYTLGWKAYLGDDARADHPYAVPLNALRLAGLPPALLLSGAGHPLCDDARRYAAALQRQGSRACAVTLADLAEDGALPALRSFLQDAAGFNPDHLA